MAPIQGPVEPMRLFELYWAAGGSSGVLYIEAPDGDTAVATVQAQPSLHGVPFEHPIVGHPRVVPVVEEVVRDVA